jgi:hypothetical protein
MELLGRHVERARYPQAGALVLPAVAQVENYGRAIAFYLLEDLFWRDALSSDLA